MAKVTSKLQVTVPKAVADRLGIKPGDDIDWQIEGHTARVVPSMSVPRLTLEQRLAIFDASTRRQARRNAEWRRKHGAREPANRGWTREELYARGRAR
jgi:AbrB family looped-hinge helix DNA binding protein